MVSRRVWRAPLTARGARLPAVELTIRPALTTADFSVFGGLVAAYEQWLRERYVDTPDFLAVLDHQDLAAELASLATTYGAPRGLALLAELDGDAVAGVAYRDLGDGTCEMKRMYVAEGLQGHGVGRRLCVELFARSAAAGFARMRLDTGVLNTEAIALYERLGFEPCAPYRDYPPSIAVYIRFMERPLP